MIKINCVELLAILLIIKKLAIHLGRKVVVQLIFFILEVNLFHQELVDG